MTLTVKKGLIKMKNSTEIKNTTPEILIWVFGIIWVCSYFFKTMDAADAIALILSILVFFGFGIAFINRLSRFLDYRQ